MLYLTQAVGLFWSLKPNICTYVVEFFSVHLYDGSTEVARAWHVRLFSYSSYPSSSVYSPDFIPHSLLKWLIILNFNIATNQIQVFDVFLTTPFLLRGALFKRDLWTFTMFWIQTWYYMNCSSSKSFLMYLLCLVDIVVLHSVFSVRGNWCFYTLRIFVRLKVVSHGDHLFVCVYVDT